MATRPSSKVHQDGKTRCYWVPPGAAHQVAYHDAEWGRPVHDDTRHFEMLCLGVAACGLSWDLVLRRREAYRKALCGFEIERVAALSDDNLDAIVAQAGRGGVVRNRAKLRAMRANAAAFIRIQHECGSFDAYVWGFTRGRTVVVADGVHPTKSEVSIELARDLKRRGMSFVGPVSIFAYLEAAGLYNCHASDCCVQADIVALSANQPKSDAEDLRSPVTLDDARLSESASATEKNVFAFVVKHRAG